MMDNNEYILTESFWNLVSAGMSAVTAGVFALLSLTGAYHAPRIVRAEVLMPADTTRNQAF